MSEFIKYCVFFCVMRQLGDWTDLAYAAAVMAAGALSVYVQSWWKSRKMRMAADRLIRQNRYKCHTVHLAGPWDHSARDSDEAANEDGDG